MEPQPFLRLSVGSLALRLPTGECSSAAGFACQCEIRLRGFPVQTVTVPLVPPATDFIADHNQHNAVVFSLSESELNALMAPGLFGSSSGFLDIAVYIQQRSPSCNAAARRRRIGMLRLRLGSEWRDGKPVLLHSGWSSIAKSRRWQASAAAAMPELHLRAAIAPDPRYVFRFEEETLSSPQIVQVQGRIRQPIFSCKFVRGRRASPMNRFSSGEEEGADDAECRERKGWKVIIHDLSGAAVASAFMSTPFVPVAGSDRVSESNPGAWLILCPGAKGQAESWRPWGRLEAWREAGTRDTVCLRLFLLPEGHDVRVLVSEAMISSDKGGEFSIDMDRSIAGMAGGGFVMSCRVQGDERGGETAVQVAKQFVTCTEDAAVFVALAAAVDLSIKACRPFRAKPRKGFRRHSF